MFQLLIFKHRVLVLSQSVLNLDLVFPPSSLRSRSIFSPSEIKNKQVTGGTTHKLRPSPYLLQVTSQTLFFPVQNYSPHTFRSKRTMEGHNLTTSLLPIFLNPTITQIKFQRSKYIIFLNQKKNKNKVFPTTVKLYQIGDTDLAFGYFFTQGHGVSQWGFTTAKTTFQKKS